MSNHIGLYIRLHKEHDKDIISCLATKENKQGFIKNLIREVIGDAKQDHDNTGRNVIFR